jgi:acetolactate synthase-1/3 small subunit
LSAPNASPQVSVQPGLPANGSSTALPVHTLSLLTHDRPGVLVRVALIFSRRGYNIESLVVSPDVTAPGLSRMTITCRGDRDTLEQIIKQLAKLVDVIHAIDHTNEQAVEAEIGLIKLRCGIGERSEILEIAEHYKAKVVDEGPESLTLRVYGDSEKLDRLIRRLEPFVIAELVRSGKVLMAPGLTPT